jgi:hypothetical protein
VLTVQAWPPLTGTELDTVAAEALSLPLPGDMGRITVRFER